MKKYLLMGFVALAFTACVSDKEVTPQTQGEKYEKAFEQLIGGPVNANVNWGFDAQQVAAFDADGKLTGMRSTNTNNNEWGRYMYVPEEMTAAQKAKVKKYFDETKLSKGISVDWSEFFVHQVSQTEKGKYMNYLYCGKDDFNAAKNNGYDAANTHVNNFNGGSSTASKNVGIAPKNDGSQNCIEKDYTDGIMYVYNSSSEMFGFYNSYDSQFYADNYIMISGEMIDEAYPEEPSVAGMYFVGFDYEHDKTHMNENDIEKRDWYFNDWVIRVSPGIRRDSKRIMVEDLIASDLSQVGYSEGKSDWDFNDAVFDVAFSREQNKNYQYEDWAIITLWAAGGTKSLTVGGKEVHELFGVPTKTMVNTAAPNGIDGLAPVIFRINLGATPQDWAERNANEIKVFVEGTELKAETGKAPQKVEVSNTTRWMKEMLIITGGYADFASYATTNAPKDWFNNVTDASKLY